MELGARLTVQLRPPRAWLGGVVAEQLGPVNCSATSPQGLVWGVVAEQLRARLTVQLRAPKAWFGGVVAEQLGPLTVQLRAPKAWFGGS